jgi:xanthine dehydrogenase molybdenum-binding subunit
MPTVSFRLNESDSVVDYDEGMHLLEVLRERCGITTVKDGCSPQGFCGCCTILLDGKPTLACLLDPRKVQGREVVTLEGLPDAQRQVLTRSFVREGAVQCGFCTPGIAMRAAHLLDRGLTDDRPRVAKALDGHLCRCTGYQRIIDAIQTAGEAWSGSGSVPDDPRRPIHFGELHGRRQISDQTPRDNGVGASAPRYRGEDQVLGTKPYVADMAVDGMLHAAVVLAEHPRARVESIDPAPALSEPGVVRVITAEDVPGQRFLGLIVHDWPVMVAVGETTRYTGDVLAVVVADSQFRARSAADKVAVSYAVMKPITNPEEALDPEAPRIHEAGNLLELCSFARGDVDTALATADHVIEETFTTQRIEHAFLEPEACLAVPEESLVVYSQGQGVHDDQRQIAALLGVELESVRVELVTNGGAFGGKEDLSIQGHAALAAHLTGCPVRLVLSREQSIRIHPKRHPITLHYTVGADGDGRLTAVRARLIGDTGAYASVGAKVLERAAGHCCGPYRVPNVDVEARTVHTNNPPCGAMRGFGANQAAFAIEGMLDRLADAVGIDGYDIRDRNILEPGDRFATGQVMNEGCGIRQTLEAVREHFKRAERAGIACGIKNTGIGNGMADVGRVLLRVSETGRVHILTGYTEMGQGLFTILRQVVAQETGLDPENLTVRAVSELAVECGMTTASRATALTTEACRRAARQLARDLQSRSPLELAAREYPGEYIVDFTVAPGAEVEDPVTHMAFGFATQVVVLTKDGTIDHVVAAHDVGRAINPISCAGQIEGGVHMGLGYALSEDFPCTGAVPDSLKLRDLGILRATQTPPVEVILVEVADPVGGYGAKGVGEIGLVPTAGAVASALHAHDGGWRRSLPMSDSEAARASVPKTRRKNTN